ncbi:MAG: hypothetical protein KF744_09040 [Taibaiella sp.]|nr:hypothetical protein [Taibaiella sp.]
MKLKVNGRVFDKWVNLSVSLVYASLASTFSFDLYFDPWDPVHREIMRPGAYNTAEVISDSGEVLITGVLLSPSFRTAATNALVPVTGYTRSGVLGDIKYSAVVDTTQSTESLAAVAKRICDAFGLKLNNGVEMPAAANNAVTVDEKNRGATCAEYLTHMAMALNLQLTHDKDGNVVITQAKTTAPVYDFEQGRPGVTFDLSFNGQMMHSEIVAEAQGGMTQNTNPVYNPYVPFVHDWRAAVNNNASIYNAPVGRLSTTREWSAVYRPQRVTQVSGETTSLETVAAQELARELRHVPLAISMEGWTLNNRIVRTGDVVTVIAPQCYLYKKTPFFVETVDFAGAADSESALLRCVLPEVYTGGVARSVFDTTGVNFDELRKRYG